MLSIQLSFAFSELGKVAELQWWRVHYMKFNYVVNVQVCPFLKHTLRLPE